MARKKENDYFAMFSEGVSCSCRAADMLGRILADYSPAQLEQHIEAMHEIEHAGDSVRHGLTRHLLKEFITPIEREDIMQLATSIDDLTDAIEDVLLRLYMFNIQAIRSDAVEFVEVIARCCAALKDAVDEFRDFRKSETLRDKIIEINRLEEDGDALYAAAMHRLYAEETNAVSVVAWTTLYDRLEKCCDRCEDIADAIESVVLKNS